MRSRVAALVLAVALAVVTLASGGAEGDLGTSDAVGISAAGVDAVGIASVGERPVEIATLPCALDRQLRSSGFVLDDELVLTVAHAVYESRDFAIRDATGRWHDAQVQHLDRERDLAVLRVPTLEASAIPLRRAEAGDVVRMIDGTTSGTVTGQVLRRARIMTLIVGSSPDEETAMRRGYELDIVVARGDSGAGIVDENDNLVGVVFAQSNTREASWAVSADEIDRVLTQSNVPAWKCERPSDARLVLDGHIGP